MLDFTKFYNKKLKAIGFGEILFDTFVDKKVLGGAPCNFAYHIKQNGIESVVVSAIGNDTDGMDASYQLASKGLVALLQRVDKETAFVKISVDKDGIASYEFSADSSYDYINYDKYVDAIAKDSNIICFGTLALRKETTQKTLFKILDLLKDKDSIKIFDINLRQNFYTRDLILKCLKYSDIFKCNEDEIEVLKKMLCPHVDSDKDFYLYLQSLGVSLFILTKGSDGSFIYYKDTVSVQKSLKVDIVDTVGAGDSFCACFIASMLKGYSLEIAHERANRLAAFVCTQQGAMPSFLIDDILK